MTTEVRILEFENEKIITNSGSEIVYVGGDSLSGFQLSPGQTIEGSSYVPTLWVHQSYDLPYIDSMLSMSKQQLAIELTSDDSHRRKLAEVILKRLYQ